VGRLVRMREAARRAYDVSRESLRAARERAEQPDGEVQDLTLAGEPIGVAVRRGEPGRTAEADQPEEPTEPTEPEAAPGTGITLSAPPPPPVLDAVPRSLQIAAAWSWRLIVVAAVGLGLLYLANRFLLLVAPLMIALLLAGLLMPGQNALRRLHVHRSLAALLVLIGGLAVVGGTLYLVVLQFIDGLPEMRRNAEDSINQIEDWLRNGPLNMTDADFNNIVDRIQQWLTDNTSDVTTTGLSAVTGTLQFVTGLVLAIVVTFFFLRDGGRIWRFLVGLLPPRARAPMAYAGNGAWVSLTGYVRATVLVALVDGVGIGVGLLILSWFTEFPRGLVLPLAALVFLGAFVPIVGAFVSGTVAVLVALVTGGDNPAVGIIQALIVLGIVILIQQLEGNVLQPFIVSKMVRLHPLAVIVAVMAGILLAGIIGALVAVPIVAVANTVIRRLHHYHLRVRPHFATPSD
jgi:predicted PurR-regulated permease PerM